MAKSLMIQGVSSDCGKSLILTALCRIFYKKGIKAAPFKAQNISLQSFVTKDGGEIAIAQALQAEAAKVDAEIHMNPILLKPSGEDGLQLIVHGKYSGMIKPFNFDMNRKKLWDSVVQSLDYMQKKYELLLVEGAGSPAEINLMEHDIANMSVAEYLNAPVIIVGDIDRGGVFASIYGTVKLLGEKENFVKGFIINKLRGYKEILTPGIQKLEALLNKDCLGIIPYLNSTGIHEEDGFSLNSKRNLENSGTVKIVIVKLKHISNFSDFDPLKFEPDVEILYSLKVEDLIDADIIIIPGSKKTAEDLKLLKNLGMEKILKDLSQKGVEIIGICGGFQMLGEKIIDSYQIESREKQLSGLGLLPIETVFYPEKITTQVEGFFCLQPSIKIRGYEIHMGKSYGNMELFNIKRLATGENLYDGAKNGNVWGTYIHGLFENDSFRRWLINKHRIKKGLNSIEHTFSWQNLKDSFIDRVACEIERNLEMDKITKLIDL